MGIRGLTGWIQWTACDTIQNMNWEQWKGKTIGIDILGFLYKTKAQSKSPFVYLAQLIASCKQCGIIPLPIFDGKPPEEKRSALKQRSIQRNLACMKKTIFMHDVSHVPMNEQQRFVVEKELQILQKQSTYFTSDERNIAKQFFYACGIMPLNAAGEADNVLAYLSKQGTISAVISNDLDLLTRGVEHLFVPELNAFPGDTSGWKHYTLSAILDSSQLCYDQFVEMCVLMGCDYTVGHFSIPYKSAYWAIRYSGPYTTVLKRYNIPIDVYTKAIDILKGVLETPETLMGEKQWAKLVSGPPNIEPDLLTMFRHQYLTDLDDATFQELF